MAFARARLPNIRSESGWSPLRNGTLARGERDLIVSAVRGRDGVGVAEPDGCGAVCPASGERGVGGVGGGEEECAQHALLLTRFVCVWIVRATDQFETLRRRRCFLCVG